MTQFSLKAIGHLRCEQKDPGLAPRQGSLATGALGSIVMDRSIPPETLKDLEGFSHIWLQFIFHRNDQWRSLVQPPRGGAKRGVFATRAPHRPNFLGLSCVRLLSVDSSEIKIADHDLLDGTPILDIKPYLVYADSFPQASGGWTNELPETRVSFSDLVATQIAWLEPETGLPLESLVKAKLIDFPRSKGGRIKQISETRFELSLKTWRFLFELYADHALVVDMRSGYSEAELLSAEDPWGDKELHRRYVAEMLVK